jgi:hypothetical protein
MAKGKQIYLTVEEMQIVRLALDEYFDICGEAIADYKENETLGYEPTPMETENYNECFRRRDVILLHLGKKFR